MSLVMSFLLTSEITREELERVHTARYLDSLSSSRTVAALCEMGPLLIMPNFLLQWLVTCVVIRVTRTGSCCPQ